LFDCDCPFDYDLQAMDKLVEMGVARHKWAHVIDGVPESHLLSNRAEMSDLG
jgi:hypothetical protein